MQIHSIFKAHHIDALLVTKPENVRYCSGFTDPDGDLLLTKRKRCLLTDFRTLGQAAKQSPEWTVVDRTNWHADDWRAFLKKLGMKRLGVEAGHMTIAHHTRLKSISRGVRLVLLHDAIENMRAVKTEREIRLITRAVRISERAFRATVKNLKHGMRESEIAWRMERAMRDFGADGHAFPTIVASGPHSANPHHANTTRKIRKDEFIILDFGAKVQGYCSDITRTVMIGKATSKQRDIFETVKRAQLSALAKMKPGVRCADVDKAARSIIENAGYGKHFGHALGHGVGLEVHEAPTLSSRSTETLKVDNIVTNEPGIYIPRFGGVRIEDDVLITSSRPRILSTLPQ
ncbi:MAG: aminopeptidase P family protein [Candidatus Kerfeldbacteria bacterium]|nr:aminopeptidase P family protein [Candidatus Kerfeldbacteria bacterium]